VYEETLTSRPHDTSAQKATSDNENMDAVQRHAQDIIEREARNRATSHLYIAVYSEGCNAL